MSNYVFLLHKLVNQCWETETQANKMSLNKHLNLHKFKNKIFWKIIDLYEWKRPWIHSLSISEEKNCVHGSIYIRPEDLLVKTISDILCWRLLWSPCLHLNDMLISHSESRKDDALPRCSEKSTRATLSTSFPPYFLSSHILIIISL